MPRFVILTHDHPMLHWDLLLEDVSAGHLLTWRLLQEPDSVTTIPAEPLSPHRLAYLDYEGPVSGNRGTVAQWDAGRYERHHSDESSETIAPFTVRLRGRRLNGIFQFSDADRAWYRLAAET